MANVTIDTPAEYALYWLAIFRPDILDAAERSEGSKMIAEDQHAAQRVKALTGA
jgi:hypothetical protein